MLVYRNSWNKRALIYIILTTRMSTIRLSWNTVFNHIVKVNVDPHFIVDIHYYLRYHATFKLQNAFTKLSVVFNAFSAMYVLLAYITVLILRLRLFRCVFYVDIEKMYCQVQIHASPTRFRKIILPNEPEIDEDNYELFTITLGINCARYVAIRTP